MHNEIVAQSSYMFFFLYVIRSLRNTSNAPSTSASRGTIRNVLSLDDDQPRVPNASLKRKVVNQVQEGISLTTDGVTALGSVSSSRKNKEVDLDNRAEPEVKKPKTQISKWSLRNGQCIADIFGV